MSSTRSVATVTIGTGEEITLSNANWILTRFGRLEKVVAINLHSVKTFDRPRKDCPGPHRYGHTELADIVAVYATHEDAIAATTPSAQNSLF